MQCAHAACTVHTYCALCVLCVCVCALCVCVCARVRVLVCVLCAGCFVQGAGFCFVLCALCMCLRARVQGAALCFVLCAGCCFVLCAGCLNKPDSALCAPAEPRATTRPLTLSFAPPPSLHPSGSTAKPLCERPVKALLPRLTGTLITPQQHCYDKQTNSNNSNGTSNLCPMPWLAPELAI